jgi:hypothetical protein
MFSLNLIILALIASKAYGLLKPSRVRFLGRTSTWCFWSRSEAFVNHCFLSPFWEWILSQLDLEKCSFV